MIDAKADLSINLFPAEGGGQRCARKTPARRYVYEGL